ncbi:NUDIX domain-containing protein [Pseudomonas oryzicola]|uniref:NUDIX domain-containing protein n=1 Tax=Pseudomonas oryzicola TaxID=485876 RepID=A0ABS6QA53_9PSED|nr:NUDIX hydrolase [Pseudomonas oryzicola]MBV4491050.1 NUDIX domain-containing protein [Pseudomonas oryzicola]
MTSKERHSTVMCLQAGKVLLVRKATGEWSLPGGKIDPGETQLDAARRELREETSLEMLDAQFLGHHVFDAEEHWLYRMAVSPGMTPHPSHEIVECRWFSGDELNQAPVKPKDLELLRREGCIGSRA